jgi:hypothetical protein
MTSGSPHTLCSFLCRSATRQPAFHALANCRALPCFLYPLPLQRNRLCRMFCTPGFSLAPTRTLNSRLSHGLTGASTGARWTIPRFAFSSCPCCAFKVARSLLRLLSGKRKIMLSDNPSHEPFKLSSETNTSYSSASLRGGASAASAVPPLPARPLPLSEGLWRVDWHWPAFSHATPGVAHAWISLFAAHLEFSTAPGEFANELTYPAFQPAPARSAAANPKARSRTVNVTGHVGPGRQMWSLFNRLFEQTKCEVTHESSDRE